MTSSRPLPQGRHLDVDHVEPVIEVLPEFALLDLLPEVPVGGCNDAHVHMKRLGAADPGDLSLLDDPQQLDLQVQIQLSDLVQEQGALVGQLKKAGLPPAAGAGKGPVLIPEQL